MDKILVTMGLNSFKTYYIFVMSCPEKVQLLEWHLLRQNYDFLVIWACERPSNKISKVLYLNADIHLILIKRFKWEGPLISSLKESQDSVISLSSFVSILLVIWIVIHWCKSSCGFALFNFAVLYCNTFLNLVLSHHFNVHISFFFC